MSRDRRPRPAVLVCAAVLALAAVCGAQDDGPPVRLDLPTTGPQFSLGAWLTQALVGEAVTASWPKAEEGSALEEPAAAIVTWSNPERDGVEIEQLRAHVRSGRGLVYVVGAGEAHIQRARSLLGPLDVNVQEADGGSGYASWEEHPLTEGAEAIGAVTPGVTISGVGGSPLAEVGGRAIAMAFDWGPLGRAVIVDESMVFDQLHQDSPRPAVRDVLIDAVLWAARAGEGAAAETPAGPVPARLEGPIWGDLPEPGPVGPPARMGALLDVPEEGDGWPQIRDRLLRELERADLEVDEPRVQEGEPVITEERLARAGMLVVGSGRESVEFAEPLAVERFFAAGGRLLFIGHAQARSQRRMIGFNDLLTGLPIATTLNRPGGGVALAPHAITAGLGLEEELRVPGGMQIWAPLTDTLVTVDGRPAAAAWQSGEGRIVVIDGELLRPRDDERRAPEPMRMLLRRAIRWLLGEI